MISLVNIRLGQKRLRLISKVSSMEMLPSTLLEQRPEMVILWAGYAFSKDYSTPRGHMHAIEDITASLRTGAPVESAPTVLSRLPAGPARARMFPRMMEALGVDSFYNNKWGALGAEIVNPIGCSDCHDPETMNLHISRPALIEAFQRQGKGYH